MANTCPLCGSHEGLDDMHSPLAPRLARRIGELARSSGVGTGGGVRMRSAVAEVSWPELVGAPEPAVAEAFALLLRIGCLRVEGGALVIPWEASGVYGRLLEERDPHIHLH